MSEQLMPQTEAQPSALEALHTFIKSKALNHGRYDVQVQVGVPGTETFQESALYGAELALTAEGQVLVLAAADAAGQIQKYVSVEGQADLFKHLGDGTYHQIVLPGFWHK